MTTDLTRQTQVVWEHHLQAFYIFWAAEPFAPLGTDTFVVRNGKIMAHTFAASMPA